MKKLPLSIGILSWNSNKVLENTLQSYKKNGLLNLSDDITVYFQEISEEDKKLAEKYGLNYNNASLFKQYGQVLGRIVKFAFPFKK